MGVIDTYLADLKARRGQPATLHKVTEGTQDPFGGCAPGTPVDHAVTVIVKHFSTEEMFAANAVIDPDDLRVFLINGEGVPEPEPMDTLTYDGAEYHIVRIVKRKRAAPVVAYDLQVRKS